ncbi:carboxypeptidase-like regulatory domain-containing protein [Emticicia sp. C21]|uniref:carboxypeptidase-like regulatory domain-containing protein n=1 Tax=Emticicia sp. C21 TaxID=2302915 RepID=UPI000E34F904|nr:carboxypeptidase-like regulatory domain-containing protein [Emticicia sp. C21]RFS17799.1 carboxypeptidase regulatory-like domain-containing protein [Emticicia sp. C21]
MSILFNLRAFVASTCLIISTNSCTLSVGQIEPDPDLGVEQSGYLIGKVTDPSGKPLSKATIYTNNTVIKDRGAETTSAGDGSYKIAMVAGLGQWIAKGYILKQYNGRVYKLLLDPENDDSFTQEEKPVRNFQWKLQGHVPDLSLNLYYGGSAELYKDPNVEDMNDTENVEFTFQPDGALIDGSQGKTLKLRGGKAGTQNRNRLVDIPIGRYKVSAVYLPTGKALKVKDAWNDDPYASSAIIEFHGTEESYRANQMGIGFRE